ncbi:MAG: hypothetical protein ACK4V6_20270 [Microthrixaceae bacterium]
MAAPRRPDPDTSASAGADPESQLPSVLARVLAFVAIAIGGAAGGLIGYAFAELGGFGGAATGAVTLLSALGGAGGVAVVAVLTLRAFGEWTTIRERDDR